MNDRDIDIVDKYCLFTNNTAIYPKECEEDYLYLGLISEVGEIAGFHKKWIRDNKMDFDNGMYEKLRSNFISECGDVLWYIARISAMRGYDMDLMVDNALNASYTNDDVIFPKGTIAQNISRCVFLMNVGSTFKISEDLHHEKDDMTKIIYAIVCLGYPFDFSIHTVILDNYHKLNSRLMRSKLEGSGDIR